MPDTFEISCIVKANRYSRNEEIQEIGGTSGGKRWRISQQSAIDGIESRKWEFYVMRGGKRVKVIVASRYGDKYLKTENDGDNDNNLLSLDSCPLN